MDTVKLHIEIEKSNYPLVKKFLENIKGIINIQEEDELLATFLDMEKKYLKEKLETVSEEDFNNGINKKLCELYPQK